MTRAARAADGSEAASAPVRCARCGTTFHCGIDDAGGCWCAKLPPLPRAAYAKESGCLCERCLREALAGAGRP